MPETSRRNASPLILFVLYLLLITAILLRRAWSVAQEPYEGMAGLNDDIMRLLSVRAWMEGQDWFDMTQYRVLPPEGLSLHWSRYVDLGIVALIRFLSLFTSDARAEGLALVIWPQLQLVLLAGLTGWAGRRTIGPWPAATAVLALLVWPIISVGYFEPLRLDHHNLQILLMTGVIVTLILPDPSVRLGIVGGVAAAFSLAIGLENLIPIALAGLVLCAETVREPQARGGQLMGFGLALGLASLLFHIGQTAPEMWLAAQCDRLSAGFLGLTLTAAMASLVLALGARRLATLGARIVLLAGTGIAGAAIVVPLLYPCLAGPYGNLPPELRNFIQNAIEETRPALYLITNLKTSFNWIIAPAIWAVVIAAIVWVRRLRDPATPPAGRRAVAILLVFGITGIVLSLVQYRLIVLAAPAVPLLAGYGIYAVFDARRKSPRHALAVLGLIAAAALSFSYPSLIKRFATEPDDTAQPANPEQTAEAEAASPALSCHATAATAPLAALPPGRVFARDRISTSILLTSDHTVLAVPYHRSAEALTYLFSAFYADEIEFRRHLENAGADYLVLCKDETFGDGTGFVSQLATGAISGWLEPLPLPGGAPLLAYRVVK